MADKRLVFDAIPDQFDRWRGRYSPALFDHVVRACALGPGRRCLELGPGTGQATDFALDAGCEYWAIELGGHFAAALRKKYGGRANFHLVNADFEQYAFPPASFDLIYSAAAIQWIDQDIAYGKCLDLLKPGGYLAMFLTRGDYRSENPALYEEIQAVYDAHFVSEAPYTQKFDYLAGERYGFTFVEQREFPGERIFTADDYVQYIGTHAGHITLKAEKRAPFFGGVRDAILRHGDRLVMKETHVLYLYRKDAD